jgi:hypothetical protein
VKRSPQGKAATTSEVFPALGRTFVPSGWFEQSTYPMSSANAAEDKRKHAPSNISNRFRSMASSAAEGTPSPL